MGLLIFIYCAALRKNSKHFLQISVTIMKNTHPITHGKLLSATKIPRQQCQLVEPQCAKLPAFFSAKSGCGTPFHTVATVVWP
jgi:hypothetical protein